MASIRPHFFVLALLLALAAAARLPASPAWAADPAIGDFEVVAPAGLTVGDHFRYLIKLEVDAGSTVTLAPGGLSPALSQTRRIQSTSRSLGNGRAELSLTLEVAAFIPGPLDLPPIKLRVRAPGGATADIDTPPSRVIIESVVPAGGVLTPRDLKPQAEIGAGSPTTLIVAMAVLVLALLAVIAALVYRLRRTPRPEPETPAAEPVSGPEDRARRVLADAATLLARGDYPAYYSTLAVTVRSYLTERFEFPAFALTTSELQERMVASGMDRWQARLVAGLLNQCDAVVFAQYRPAPERADADLTAAYEIVEMSRPVASEAPVA